MNGIISDTWRALGDALIVPLLLVVFVALLIMLGRPASSLWYFIRQRGRRPLVIQVVYADKQEGGEDYGALDARLLSYLAGDGHGNYVIAPGAGGPAAPRVPAESLEPSAALLRLAFAREPAYRVDVTWPSRPFSETDLRAAVRISRTPGDRIVASRSFVEDSTDELIEIIGCFCITFLRSQPRILRYTPRWERWSQDVTGYRAYRRGLEAQHRAEIASSHGEYRTALECFDKAARIEPANMLVQLHRAALLELDNAHRAAVAIYKKCRTLWPEHIETAYRLGNAHKSTQGKVTPDELRKPLQDIRTRLGLTCLAKAWLHNCAPYRWNPGERRYWGSWLRLSLPGGITKRSMYLNAVAISELLARLSVLLDQLGCRRLHVNEGRMPGTSESDGAQLKASLEDAERRIADPKAASQRKPEEDEVEELMIDFAGKILRMDKVSVDVPPPDEVIGDTAGSHYPHVKIMHDLFYPAYGGPQHRRRKVGWLAMFNAACFFSLAIDLAPDHIPYGFSAKEWRDHCARASIRELGLIFRDPRHALDPAWLGTDPDLKPLLGTAIGKDWASFVGLKELSPTQLHISPDGRDQPTLYWSVDQD
jgi:tetratricopeptide (TPR) repeat protein